MCLKFKISLGSLAHFSSLKSRLYIIIICMGRRWIKWIHQGKERTHRRRKMYNWDEEETQRKFSIKYKCSTLFWPEYSCLIPHFSFFHHSLYDTHSSMYLSIYLFFNTWIFCLQWQICLYFCIKHTNYKASLNFSGKALKTNVLIVPTLTLYH